MNLLTQLKQALIAAFIFAMLVGQIGCHPSYATGPNLDKDEPPIDFDGDGFNISVDCDDTDPLIHECPDPDPEPTACTTGADSDGDGIANQCDNCPMVANPDQDEVCSAMRHVSVGVDGKAANNTSFNPSISADGRYVAFRSASSNLVEGDTNDKRDIFLHDRVTEKTTRVSVATNGTEGDDDSWEPSISDDGRYISFSSDASTLVEGDTNSRTDIFLYDRVTRKTTRVSVATDGTEGDNNSYDPSLSANGEYVTFRSYTSNLIGDDTNGVADIFLHNRVTQETTRINLTIDSTEANYGSYKTVISADGLYAAFRSHASNLVGDNANGNDIFLVDLTTKAINRVSVNSDGDKGNGGSYEPSISGDGQYVTFHSSASNLVEGDTNDASDIFLYDRVTEETTRMSMATDGTEGNNSSRSPSISADGRYIAFHSYASNLVEGDTNERSDIFLHDRVTQETVRLSSAADGTEGNGRSHNVSISGDGRYVTFHSSASNLVEDDTNVTYDIFVRENPLWKIVSE